MQAAAVPNTPVLKVIHNWAFLYTPSHIQTITETEIGGFAGIEKKSEKYICQIAAQCYIQAEIASSSIKIASHEVQDLKTLYLFD